MLYPSSDVEISGILKSKTAYGRYLENYIHLLFTELVATKK